MADITPWFKIEMDTGIAMLARLSLADRPMTPKAEQALGEIFAEALWPNSKWEVADTPRIRVGFRSLIKGERDVTTERGVEFASRRFPQPKDLEAAIPRRTIPESRQVEHKPTGNEIHISKSKAIAAVRKFMRSLDPVGGAPYDPSWTELQKVNWLRGRRGEEPFKDVAAFEENARKMRAAQDKRLASIKEAQNG